MLVLCVQCGHEISISALLCPNCGHDQRIMHPSGGIFSSFCKACGRLLKHDSGACPFCGHPISEVEVPNPDLEGTKVGFDLVWPWLYILVGFLGVASAVTMYSCSR